MDLTAAQAKLTNVQTMFAALNLPSSQPHKCETCGVRFAGPLSLAEHVYNSHGGDVPAHYLAAEHAAGIQ